MTIDISKYILSKYDTSKHDIALFDIKGWEMPKTNDDSLGKYLPLSESTYYILLTLIEPLHGYGVMQKVEEISLGTAIIGPGTLYGTFSQLEKEGLIVKVSEEERRKSFQLTDIGKKVLLRQIERLEIMNRNGQDAIKKIS